MRKLRAWLVWLVVAVMPLQGLSAATMALGRDLASTAQGASATVGHPAGHGNGHADGAAWQGHAPVADPGTGDGGVFAAADTADCGDCSDSHAAHGLLGCCGAACAPALAMTAGLSFGHAARPPAPQHALPGLHSGVVLDGLDRPPRSS